MKTKRQISPPFCAGESFCYLFGRGVFAGDDSCACSGFVRLLLFGRNFNIAQSCCVSAAVFHDAQVSEKFEDSVSE